MTHRFSIKGAIRIATINLGLLLAGLVALDLVFGDWLRDENMGAVRVLKNVELEFDVSGLYPGHETALYRRDKWGLRGDYGDPGAIDIMTIGGSTTDLRMLGEGYTWQDYLRDALKKKGAVAAIANAGVDGQTTIGHIESFRHWYPKIPGLQARFVLAYVGLNDVHTEFHAWSDDVMDESLKDRVRQAYRNNSVYYRNYRLIKGWWKAKKARLIHHRLDMDALPWARAPMHSDHAEKMADRVEGYRKRLKVLVRQIRDFGARPILVTQPRGDVRVRDGAMEGLVDGVSEIDRIYPRTNGLDRRIIQDMFNRATLEVCAQAPDAVCLDLAGELAFEKGDFYDQVHYAPKGAKRIGDYLAGKLAPYLRPSTISPSAPQT